VGCYVWYSEEGPGRAETPPSPLLAVPNVTAHPSRHVARPKHMGESRFLRGRNAKIPPVLPPSLPIPPPLEEGKIIALNSDNYSENYAKYAKT